jgi:hypothetical protein
MKNYIVLLTLLAILFHTMVLGHAFECEKRNAIHNLFVKRPITHARSAMTRRPFQKASDWLQALQVEFFNTYFRIL